MKNNKGFTLIELLAVIVILAIIALIATPTILGVVENARQGAAESSVLGFVDAVEKQSMINEMDANTANDFSDAELTIAQLTGDTYKVSVKGQVPSKVGATKSGVATDGKVKIVNGEVQTQYFELGKYVIKYDAATGKADANAE